MIDTRSPEARERLREALVVPRLVEEVAAAGPYPTGAALAAAAETALADVSDAELTAAAGVHGASAAGPGEPGLARSDEGGEAALARGYEVYEQRFGRGFVIDAGGRSPQQVLDELQRRLKNDPDEEAEEARQQLRGIVDARLRAVFGG